MNTIKNIVLSSSVRIGIVHVDNPVEFWAQVDDGREEARRLYRDLYRYMSDRGHLHFPNQGRLTTGRLVAYRSKEGTWVRGEVQHLVDGQFEVALRDHGKVAFKVRVRGIRPVCRTWKIEQAKRVLEGRRGLLTNIRGEGEVVADVALDRLPGQPPFNVAEAWLGMRYAVPGRV
ncbi:uncharacterized protein LOC143305638 [Osmia lignaria lignaria]|uniref:uncharacterized protein LOC117610183 n=1 Tax=Osmia lignaria TaxID=473952 RepID=UPI0014784D09|nr:uncharacterized protein LOC117610183 [Osmia lignaria]XP_034195137.1 uncharacterized protein LOC117611297 [Osmia lignaria]